MAARGLLSSGENIRFTEKHSLLMLWLMKAVISIKQNQWLKCQIAHKSSEMDDPF